MPRALLDFITPHLEQGRWKYWFRQKVIYVVDPSKRNEKDEVT